jgi:hypothetical protein
MTPWKTVKVRDHNTLITRLSEDAGRKNGK